MKILAFFCFFCVSFSGLAQSSLPVGCLAVTVQGEDLRLKSKKNKVVFIHNLTTADLWLTHTVAHSTIPSAWASRLQREHWSALAVDQLPFVLSCIESRPGHEQQLPCAGAIAVCEWPKVELPGSEKGELSTFWIEEDKSLSALTAALSARGLVLPLAK